MASGRESSLTDELTQCLVDVKSTLIRADLLFEWIGLCNMILVVIRMVQVSWNSRISQMVMQILMISWSRFRSLVDHLRLGGPRFHPHASALQQALSIVQNHILDIH